MVLIERLLAHTRRQKTLFTALVAVGFASSAIGAGYPLNGVSPVSRAYLGFQNAVFTQVEQERLQSRLLNEARVKDQIQQVIARYRTGLNLEKHSRVPEVILEASRKYGFDPMFLTAVIVAESSFYNWAKSRRGALGLMQIRPHTARALASETEMVWQGKLTLYDPIQNISLGAYYLNKLIERFGDLTLALEAYNHGPSQLNRYLRKGKRPHRYSKKVLRLYRSLRSQSI